MNRKTIIRIVTIVLAVTMLSSIVEGATHRLSRETGNFQDRMRKAVNKARANDTILVDVPRLNSTVPYTLTKSRLTIRGVGSSRPLVKRNAGSTGGILFINANNITLENIKFDGGNRTVLISKPGKTYYNLSFKNCEFITGGWSALIFDKTNLVNVRVESCQFRGDYGINVLDCKRIQGFRITNSVFTNKITDIGFDNPLVNSPNHRDIILTGNRHNRMTGPKRDVSNVAFANTRNIVVRRARNYGGITDQSECLHIEDRTQNLLVVDCWLNNSQGGAGIVTGSTDRMGHGTGRRLTPAEKVLYGSGNLRFKNNRLIRGGVRQAIYTSHLRTYGSNGIGYKLEGVNTVNSRSTVAAFWNYKVRNNQRGTVKIDPGNKVNGTVWGSASTAFKNRNLIFRP